MVKIFDLMKNLIELKLFLDPGWLKTFEEYFNDQTKNILNSAVDKLPGLPDMTFIWTEISFLSLWFETASPMRKKIFKDLVQSGRIEITTGMALTLKNLIDENYCLLCRRLCDDG